MTFHIKTGKIGKLDSDLVMLGSHAWVTCPHLVDCLVMPACNSFIISSGIADKVALKCELGVL